MIKRLQNLESDKKSIIVISGLAGSGKTSALHALEDLGYYCIDNLPAALFTSFCQAVESGTLTAPLIALALDSRDQSNPKSFHSIAAKLQKICRLKILYLYASQEILIKRFRETRRHHPLSLNSPHVSLQDAIKLDQKTLEPLKEIAHRLLDTSDMPTQHLKRFLKKQFADIEIQEDHILLNLISFGFKHGTPNDFDTLFDVRCFKNPYYDKCLRSFTGLSAEVKKYVLQDEKLPEFLNKIVDFISYLYPLYCEEGKYYFSVGIGCTGGKHRSVVVTEELALILRKSFPFVITEHRHIELP